MQLPVIAFRILPCDLDHGLLPTKQLPATATASVAAERPLVGRPKEMQLILGRLAGMLRDKQGSAGAVIIEGCTGEWWRGRSRMEGSCVFTNALMSSDVLMTSLPVPPSLSSPKTRHGQDQAECRGAVCLPMC